MSNESDDIAASAPGAAEESAPGSGSVRTRRPRKRTFYSIGEVCSMVGIKPHVLRYWESQFEELSPTKNRSGNRVYQAGEIELIALIHRLVHEERYTVEGAKKRLAELNESGATDERSTEALRRAFVRGLARELEELHELLDPS